jgi:hypothetical protein
MLNPPDDPREQTRRHVVMKSSFATFSADLPRGVAAQYTACNRAEGQQPWVSAVCHQPKQQQVGAARQSDGDNRGIEDSDKEEPQRSQVRKPSRHQWVVHLRRWQIFCLPANQAHSGLAVHLRFKASILEQWAHQFRAPDHFPMRITFTQRQERPMRVAARRKPIA